jgi:hypothetical protein
MYMEGFHMPIRRVSAQSKACSLFWSISNVMNSDDMASHWINVAPLHVEHNYSIGDR